MMYPETFLTDKGHLNVYKTEYENDYEEQPPGCLQRLCCFKRQSQFCPKCGCYHKSNSVRRCLCLTLTTLLACICFVALTVSVTFVNDMQSSYEVVHHFLILITNTNETSHGNHSSDTPIPHSTDRPYQNDSTESNETLYTDSLDYIIQDDEDNSQMYNSESYEREKRSVNLSFKKPSDETDMNEEADCVVFLSLHLNDSSNPAMLNKDFTKNNNELLNTKYRYCQNLIKSVRNNSITGNISAPSTQLAELRTEPVIYPTNKQTDNLSQPLEISDKFIQNKNLDKVKEKKSAEKSSTRYINVPIEHFPLYKSEVSKSHPSQDLNGIVNKRSATQNIPYISDTIRTSHPYPPTGPDGSNFAETVKTSQQLTVANNQIWKPVCFRAQNSPNSSPFVCLPMVTRQFDPNQGLHNQFSSNPDTVFNKECVGGNCDKKEGINAPLPTIIVPNSDVPDLANPSGQQAIIISPTNSPNIHVPTAISSPNPYFFPTFNGAPIMSPVPYDSRQVQPHFNPVWTYRGGLPGFPPPHFYGQHYIGPQRLPGNPNHYQPMISQPQFHMLPPQSQVDFQNPVLCMYVPSQSHRFPVVNGVMKGTNRNADDDSSESVRQSQSYDDNTSHGAYKSGSKECAADEFACKLPDTCIPLSNWCNGRADCPDASDETECSCKYRVDKKRLCDGYFDCPSGEDELGCFGCDITSFSCQDWEQSGDQPMCVPLSKRCDNVVDCSNRNDELECALLSESVVPHKTHFVSYTSGLLHRNWQGRWYPACTGSKITEWAVQACLADAGYLTGDPVIEMVPTAYPGPFIIPNGPDKYTLSQMCQEQKVVTYVTCPPVQCGTRVVTSFQNPRKPQEMRFQNFNKMSPRSHETPNSNGDDFINGKPEAYFNEDPITYEATILKGRDDKYSPTLDNKDGYCETCSLKTNDGNSFSHLIASKSEEYQTQYEPTEEDYERWTRDSDDILGVVGGGRSTPLSWPWLIALYQDGKFHCGGVIVNEFWVMTAAHCVERHSVHYYEVQAGMLRRFSFSPQEQTIRISHVVLHNLYDGMNMQNDLALLHLQSRLKYNRWVRPICLPQEHISQYGPPPGSLCTAVGWGAVVEGGPDPDDLNEVNVPILPYCKHRVDQEGAGICAGYLRGGHDTCQGDSGGPLLCKSPGGDEKWYVAGVVSHGEGCARPDEPGVYTRVFLFLDWIRSTISEHGSNLSAKQMPLQECPGQQCDSGRRCIPLSKLCDTRVDCLGAEDETICQQNFLRKSSPFLGNITEDDNTDYDESSSYNINKSTTEKSYTLPVTEKSENPSTTEETSEYSNGDLTFKSSEYGMENTDSSDETVYNSNYSTILETQPATTKDEGNVFMTRPFIPEDENTDEINIVSTTNEPYVQYSTENDTTAVYTQPSSTTDKVIDVTPPSNLHYQDTRLIDELIHQDNDSPVTEKHDIHYVNIPHYLIPILFPNGTSQRKIESEGINSQESKLEDNMKFKNTESIKNITNIRKRTKEEIRDIEQRSELREGKNKTSLLPTGKPQSQSLPEPTESFDTSTPSHDLSTMSEFHFVTPKVKFKDNLKGVEGKFSVDQNAPKESETVRKHEQEVYENFCKSFMSHKEIKSDDVGPKNRNESHSRNSGKFNTVENVSQKNFSIFTSETEKIHNNTSRHLQEMKRDKLFLCKRYMQPLLRRRRCDGFIDCEDGSDEENCSCRERLQNNAPNLVCDGEVHCYDQSDERQCARKCKKREFFCSKSKICIPLASHCDGKQDCPKNDDEDNCYALMAGDKVKVDRGLMPELSQEGIVAVKSGTRWRPLCVPSNMGRTAALKACTSVGFLGYKYFQEVKVKNESLREHNSWKESTPVCSGLRVKCSSWKADTHWLGSLFIEGRQEAAVAMISSSWFLTHSSVCQELKLEMQYTQVSIGRNKVSGFGFRGVYEEVRRVDDLTVVKDSSFCLLHSETPIHLNRKVRPTDLQTLIEDANIAYDLYAVVLSEERFYKFKLNESRKYIENDDLCFTVSQLPSVCYVHGGVVENGFIVMDTQYNSSLVATFNSYKTFCSLFQHLCLKKLSQSSFLVPGILENRQVSPVVAPPCDGVRCGKCVKWTDVSNGEPDCLNLLDESSEAYKKRQLACQTDPGVCGCKSDQLQCSDGSCIDKSLYCDGVAHCADGSDEPKDCEDNCFRFLQSIYPQKICDGVRNCFDKSDETWDICQNLTCSLQNAYSCKRSEKCIPQEFICDNEADCPDGDDEENCVAILHTKLGTEGTLSQHSFGVWSPRCLNSSSVDLTGLCTAMGKSKAISQDVVSPNSTVVAADSFSPVKLNNITTVVIRKGRSFFETDTSLRCKYLYIKCV